MEVYIDNSVHLKLIDFYEYAREKHPTLDESTITQKMLRIYEALNKLGKYACVYPISRLENNWKESGYREYLFEDFHFAYQIIKKDDGIEIVRVRDVCYSALYK